MSEIEAHFLARIRRRHHEPHPYWATTDEAAAQLGVSRSNLPLMMLSDRLPYATDGTCGRISSTSSPMPGVRLLDKTVKADT